MTTQNGNYVDIQEGRPRVTSYDDNGVRTTTTTTRLGPDPSEKPRETVSVRTVQHPDSTETITVTEKKLPPIRFTETIMREKAPKKVQIAKNTTAVGPATEVLESINIPPTATEVAPYPKTYNVVRRERVIDEPNTVLYPPARPDRFIVTQTEPTTTPRLVIRQTPEPTSTTTIIRQPTPISYLQVPPRTTRIVQVRQAPSPVVIDVDTPPLTTTKKTTIINDNRTDTLIDDRRTLVNYQDDYYTTRRTGRRSDWCGNCGADCCGCSCFDDCCGTTNCCRTNSFARRKDVASYRTRVTKDGRRVRYRNADVPGYRFCNCCTGWCSRICPCCGCLEWFCACPCWLWLCCLLPLLLGLLGLSIGLLTQLPAINSNTNSNANQYNELRVTQSYNTVLAVLGENAPCQPDRNLAGIPLYCDQTTTQFTVSATSSSSTVFVVPINGSVQIDFDDLLLFILLSLSFFIQQYFQFFTRSLFPHVI